MELPNPAQATDRNRLELMIVFRFHGSASLDPLRPSLASQASQEWDRYAVHAAVFSLRSS